MTPDRGTMPGSQWAAEYDHLTAQTPASVNEDTGAGFPAGRCGGSGPSGRHAATGADDEVSVQQVRSWLAMQDALKVRRAEMRYAHALLAEAVRR